MTPRIAIPVSTSFDLAYNQLNSAAYADAVRASGGTPVEIALDLPHSELVALADSCDAILLPGSPADVDPARYGQTPEETTAPADAAREAVDRYLLEQALHTGKPVFGICFGTQMINVYFGGTLVQDLAPMPVNHPAGRAVAVAHTVAVDRASLLAESIDHAELTEVDGELRLPVNSSHHQAVGIAGSKLRVTARCPQDGVAEAVELPGDDFLLGVQWHPERTFHSSASSRALFTRFVHEAAVYGVMRAASSVPA